MPQLNKQIFFFFLFVSATISKAQKLDSIIEQIKKVNEVQHQFIGFGGDESEQYKRFERLKWKADTSLLLKLTKDKNGVLACYAGWALIDKGYKNIDAVLTSFLEHDVWVTRFSGCTKMGNNISSEFYHRYWNSVDDKNKATDKTLFLLDSIILYNKNTDWLLLVRALENRKYPLSYNKQIEYLAFEKINKDAITYLSNWYGNKYDDRIKPAFEKYLVNTDFSTVGVNVYYYIVEELLKFKDEKINKIIIEKLKKDKFWKNDEKKFISHLKYNDIDVSEIE